MADLSNKVFITLANLAKYDEKIKAYLADADSVINQKSLKSIAVDNDAHQVKFYREEEANISSATPAYTLDLSGYDTAISTLSGKINTINGNSSTTGSFAKAIKDAVDALNKDLSKRITDLDTKVGTIPTTASATTVVGYIDAKVSEINGTNSSLAGRVSTLETSVTTLNGGESVTGSVAAKVKAAKDALSSEISAVDTKAGEAKSAAATNATAIAAINNTSTGILANAKSYTDGKIGTLPSGKSTVVAMVDAVEDSLEGQISTVRGTVNTVSGKVTTLIGNDAGKSARTIANEELAAQLLTGKADADFKTLQSLAAWLEDHPEEVAEINKNIQSIKTLIGTIPTSVKPGASAATPDYSNIVTMIQGLVNAEKSRATGAESGLGGRISTLETAVGDGGSVATKISNAINALDYTDNVSGDVVTSVSEANGVISVTKARLTFATDQQVEALFATNA